MVVIPMTIAPAAASTVTVYDAYNFFVVDGTMLHSFKP
jgi:hypothetical protein